jgi:hypothetical protein
MKHFVAATSSAIAVNAGAAVECERHGRAEVVLAHHTTAANRSKLSAAPQCGQVRPSTLTN